METDSKARKRIPLCTGVLDYFPDALVEVAILSQIGNDKHNPNEPLHHARGKSMDHADCMLRHQIEYDQLDTDGLYHAVKVAWRALAQLQELLERERGLPLPRGARIAPPAVEQAPSGAVDTAPHICVNFVNGCCYVCGKPMATTRWKPLIVSGSVRLT